MHAPDAQEHIAYRYVRHGMSVIPLVPRDKKPYGALLPDGKWAPFQQQPASLDQVRIWLQTDPTSNWGIVCGVVSGGTYCGDCDNMTYSRWVLDHARDPIFQGACIIETGAHKAHIWFRSPTKLLSGRWKPRSGKAVGDIRGDGQGSAGASYMVAPPSIHPDTGDPYVVRAGSMDDLPIILNGEAFLQGILAAYLSEHPDEQPEARMSEKPGSKHILVLEQEDQHRVWRHVRSLGLKTKIRDTILVPGNQTEDTRYWLGMEDGSGSGIDFAVVAELIRKNQSFEQVEQVFAACIIGEPRYRNTRRPNHGFDYLRRTFDNARLAVAQAEQAKRVATGNNFRVVEASRLAVGTRDAVYRLSIVCVKADRSEVTHRVEVSDDDLLVEGKTRAAVFKQTQFMLDFSQGHKGQHFWNFAAAVANMVTDVEWLPESQTRIGFLAATLRDKIGILPTVDARSAADTHTLGWRWNERVYLRGTPLTRMLRSADHNLAHSEIRHVLEALGVWGHTRYTWPSGEGTESIIVLRLS